MLKKIKALFVEPVPQESNTISPRAARLSGASTVNKTEEQEFQVRKWVKSTLSTAPWAALAIILFAVFLQGAVATGALIYGLVKAAIAVLVTVIADETMFNGLKDQPQHGWLPMIRRSMVFIGVCWLMAVT